ncbi:MAG: PadR family transcriptional regulator [Candidatus Dormibacteraeota bacterium]|nr:PadR family transcriptional regulator [Candidatus Dormibacteraeota bacterium]
MSSISVSPLAPEGSGASPVATLGYALLGLIARGPASGYDLAKAMHRPIGYFWEAHQGQIYPELGRLEQAGLIVVADRETGGRGRKTYGITDAGLGALRTWVARAMEPARRKDELVLRTFSLWVGDPAEMARLYREQERTHRDRQAAYERFLADGGEPEAALSPDFAAYATLRRGLGHEREYADWCAWMAERMEGLAAARSHSAARRRGSDLADADENSIL